MQNRSNAQKKRARRRMYKLLATFDHLVPKAKGGTNKKSNLRLAHQKCNNLRSDLPTVNVVIAMLGKAL